MGLRKRETELRRRDSEHRTQEPEREPRKGAVLERWRPEQSRRQPPEGTMCARGYIRSWQTERATPTDAVAIDFGARWSLSCEGSAWAERLGGAKKEVAAIVARGVRASSHETGEHARAARRRVEDRCSLALQSRTAPPGGAVTGAFRGGATALSCPRERRQLHDWRGRRRSAPGKCMSVCAPTPHLSAHAVPGISDRRRIRVVATRPTMPSRATESSCRVELKAYWRAGTAASNSRGSAVASRIRGSPPATDTRTSGGSRGTP